MNENQAKIKSVSYARVSSKEQEDTGYSLDAQENLLTGYAKEKSYTVAKRFRVAESASKWQIRKTLNEMLAYADKNSIPVILCEKIDRLTRSLKDAVLIDDWVHAKEGREVHFVKEHFILNQNTKAHDNFVWDMKVAVARFYTNNLSEEVRKGQKEKIAQGWLPTKPPLGYKTIGDKGHKIHVIDETKAPLIRKMFELYSTGNYSLKAITEIMQKEGLRNANGSKVCRSRIHELLSDPFYYGKMQWKGTLSQGKHDPLITQELFDAVQVKLARKTASPSYRKHLPVFKAMIDCAECGGLITWEIQKGNWYGHCNHHRQCSQKKYVRQNKVEEQLFPCFDKVAPANDEVLAVLEKALKEDHSDEVEYNDSKRKALNRIVANADRRAAAAYSDKIDGRMPANICLKVIEDSEREKKDALKSLKKLSEGMAMYYEAGFAIHELALQAKDIYLSPKATTEDKRLLLSQVFKSHTLRGAIMQPNYTLAFEFLHKWMPRVNPAYAKTKNLPLGEVFSDTRNFGHPHGTVELSTDGSSELRNNFRTSENPYPIKRFKGSDPKSRDLLPG